MAKDTDYGFPPWDKDLRRVVLSDGSYVVGQTILDEAQKHSLGTGGYTMCLEKTVNERFRLIPVDRWDKAANLNALASNAVIILASDPRAQLIDMMITRSKERHRPVRVIVGGHAVGDTIKWLEDLNAKSPIKRLCVAGTGANTVAKAVADELLPAYSKLLVWTRES